MVGTNPLSQMSSYVPPGLNCHQTDIANDCDVAHCLMKNNAILALNLQYALIKFYFYGFLFTFKVKVNKLGTNGPQTLCTPS